MNYDHLLWWAKAHGGIDKVQITLEPALRLIMVIAEGHELGVIVSTSPEESGQAGAMVRFTQEYTVAQGLFYDNLSLKDLLIRSGSYEPSPAGTHKEETGGATERREGASKGGAEVERLNEEE